MSSRAARIGRRDAGEGDRLTRVGVRRESGRDPAQRLLVLEPHVSERAAGKLTGRPGREGEEEVLGADVGVAETARLLHSEHERSVQRPVAPVAGPPRPELVDEVVRCDVGRLEHGQGQPPDSTMAATRSTVVASPSAAARADRDHPGRAARQAALPHGFDTLAGGNRVGQRLLADGGDGNARRP